jgi:hypothetical protein
MSSTNNDRIAILTYGLNLHLPGLEVSPLYRPTVRKAEHNVFYTDYCSAEESRRKHANYSHDEIMDIDFVWTPGKRLRDCVNQHQPFHWAISSHVMEHVPDPIGWLLQVLEVLDVGGVFSLALPDKRYCFDKFRNETEASLLIEAWLHRNSIPGAAQLFDFLCKSVDGSGEVGQRAFDRASKYEDAKRHYSDTDALNFVLNSWTTGKYFDAHCTVYTPESFVNVFRQINNLGILNAEISEPQIGHEEFFVKLTKIGEPRISHPGTSYLEQQRKYAPDSSTTTLAAQESYKLQQDLQHARDSFYEAVKLQNEFKAQIENLTTVNLRKVELKNWLPNWIKPLITR